MARRSSGSLCCYSGDLAEGERVSRPLRAFGNPIADVVGPASLCGLAAGARPAAHGGRAQLLEVARFPRVERWSHRRIRQRSREIPNPQTEIAFAQLGGAVGRVPTDATAYTHRDAQFVVNIHGRWADPAKDAACTRWVRDLFNAATPFATGGVYVNFLTQEEGDRVQAAYGSNYGRLAQLKSAVRPGEPVLWQPEHPSGRRAGSNRRVARAPSSSTCAGPSEPANTEDTRAGFVRCLHGPRRKIDVP